MNPQTSGRLPSASVTPYSLASRPLSRERPFQRDRSGSAASAATPLARYTGDSERAQCFCLSMPSRQLSSVRPKTSSISSERMNPGVTATAAQPTVFSSSPRVKAMRIGPFLARS
ncbi:hypothetical protein RKD30_002037 [Streptomyces pristinaespiralis]